MFYLKYETSFAPESNFQNNKCSRPSLDLEGSMLQDTGLPTLNPACDDTNIMC